VGRCDGEGAKEAAGEESAVQEERERVGEVREEGGTPIREDEERADTGE
jgi:hypothetical protein